jgi:sugar/nucleoside kinase (ribokinase family)
MKLPVALPSRADAVEVVGLGENSLELVATVGQFPQPDSKQSLEGFEWLPGGQTATSVIGCARLGCATRYVGVVGDDDAGKTIARALASEGVHGEPVAIRGVRTRFAIVLVDQRTGARTILEGRDANLEIPSSLDFVSQALSRARVLLVDSTSAPAALRASAAANALEIPTVLDVDRSGPNAEWLMSKANVLICPERFVEEITGASLGEGLRRLQAGHGNAVVIATLGAQGSLALVSEREIRTRGFKVDVVDSTGAGDAFRAGLVARWLQLGPEADADTLLEYANAAAALNCRKLGAQSGLPTRAEVESLLTAPPGLRSN